MNFRKPRRWSALFLLSISPAVGGQLLALLHPCPAVAQSVAAAPAGEHGHHAAHPQHAPGHRHGGEEGCTCPGPCHSPALTDAPRPAALLASAVAAPRGAAWPMVERHGPSPRPLDRLPPATAPPLA